MVTTSVAAVLVDFFLVGILVGSFFEVIVLVSFFLGSPLSLQVSSGRFLLGPSRPGSVSWLCLPILLFHPGEYFFPHFYFSKFFEKMQLFFQGVI
jgi:hypothetical protein